MTAEKCFWSLNENTNATADWWRAIDLYTHQHSRRCWYDCMPCSVDNLPNYKLYWSLPVITTHNLQRHEFTATVIAQILSVPIVFFSWGYLLKALITMCKIVSQDTQDILRIFCTLNAIIVSCITYATK